MWDCKSLPKTFITRHKNDIVSTWIPGCQKKDFIVWKYENLLVQGFSSMALLKPQNQGILCVAVCCVHCRMFSSLPGLYPLAHPPHRQTVTTKITPRHCQISSERQNCQWMRTVQVENTFPLKHYMEKQNNFWEPWYR